MLKFMCIPLSLITQNVLEKLQIKIIEYPADFFLNKILKYLGREYFTLRS